MGPGRRLKPRLRAVRRPLAVAATAGVLATVLTLAQWTLLAVVLAPVTRGQATAVPPGALAGLAGLVAGRALLAAVVAGSGQRAATTVTSALRLDLARQRLTRGRAGRPAEPKTSARTATQAIYGLDGLDVYLARYVPQRVQAAASPCCVLVLVAVLDPPSALVLLVALPVVPVFMVLIGRSAAERSRANLAALDALAAHFLDVVRGLSTLRVFNQAWAQTDAVGAVTERYRVTTSDTLRLAFLSGAVLDLAATSATALVAVGLGVRLVAGTVDLLPAMIVLFVVPELFAPLRRLGSLFHASADGLAAAGKVLDDLDDLDGAHGEGGNIAGGRVEPRGSASGIPGPSSPGTGSLDASIPSARIPDLPGAAAGPVRLREVDVRYQGRARPALDRVDLDLAPGQLVVVVGPSGAGKSTLGRVLVGLTRPDHGEVSVGGRPLTDADLDGWRRQVAWAPQRPGLLTRSVLANVALGVPSTDRACVVDAVRRAGAHTFVAALPDGYDTVVGPGGHRLSAGQRQRLGLARALVREASLTVLDEPTAYLDGDAAGQVAATVEGLRGRRTIVLITHDVGLVPDPDQVVHLVDGRVEGHVSDLSPAAVEVGGPW